MNNVFFDKAKEIKKFSVNETLKKFFALPEIQTWIIETIQNRLYDHGEDNENKKLKTDLSNHKKYGGKKGYYAGYTEFVKKYDRTPQQPIDRVTLKDTGKFYNSFKLQAGLLFAEMKANFKKPENQHIENNFLDFYNSTKDFETAILSLTDEELNFLIDNQLKTYFMFEIRKYV